ncbi:centromere protein I [Diachasma alloeum]|uniref:centromere protein I n=1 Tax=Diachasma alloeum TaxID=454923 RepID=UPI00073812C3|nr:centromere protein I [Diachasma alloeum]
MSNDDRKAGALRRLKELKTTKGKRAVGTEEAITILKDEAATRGLETEDIESIVDVIASTDLRAGLCVPLIHCLIPRKKIPEKIVESVINFWLHKWNDLPITVASTVLQWLTGLWEYQLVDRQTINVYYDCFFHNMLKKERLESPTAKLVYLLTKPEDVTRRQVTRLLRLQDKYTKPPKHLSALLSLFKSYKPELVPEKIPSLNLESVWKPIPEVFRLGFEDAKSRSSQTVVQGQEHFDWNPMKLSKGKTTEQLLPSIRYFQMGSSIYRDKTTKSIFDLSNIVDVGRYYFSVELPTNATSLLANTAGYHFLTFANFEYQSRFSHNLYNTLRWAFILECSRFSKAQKTQLLEMTIEFCRYMQQGNPVVLRFLLEYLPYESAEYRPHLLGLLEWCTQISVTDLQENLAPHLEEIFLESSLPQRCQIIRSLRKFLRNIFVNQNFGIGEVQSSPFLGQKPTSELTDLLPPTLAIAENLILRGLNASCNDLLILNEALGFYEEVHMLVESSETPGLILAPPAVIYGTFCSRSCALISKVCGLLLKYRETCMELMRMGVRGEFAEEVERLLGYGNDLGNALWNSRVFSGRRGGFFRGMAEGIEELLPEDADGRHDIMRHIAFLPYIYTLGQTGLDISSKEAALVMAQQYFPNISEFIEQFDQPFE